MDGERARLACRVRRRAEYPNPPKTNLFFSESIGAMPIEATGTVALPISGKEN
jgi:hypothetical protein